MEVGHEEARFRATVRGEAGSNPEALESAVLALVGELHAAIRQAHAEGAGLATIARVAGLSRERVRQLVSGS